MFKKASLFKGLVTLGTLALAFGGAVSASAADTATNAGPGTSSSNLSENTSVSNAKTIFTPDEKSNTATGKSTAEFKVNGGVLNLVAVPDLNFGEISGNTIINGGTQKLVDNTVTDPGTSKEKTAFDGNATGDLIISDLRGTTGGWTLNAAMNPEFTTDGGTAISGVTLDLKGSANSSLSKALTLSGTKINGTAQAIVDGKSNGAGDTDFKLSTSDNATLTFPANTNSAFTSKAPYQSDITWTLVAAQ
ncbi:WxL domain-containing protein [uncultured Secundilactobacillus sp.]|uniref:WxL domain-containing protein n=1 Tax=uncultured Secundilactobacillus sp. TaxID=2813935 RepID=UPI0025834246|nr:WxL domain-containing protein [uncultured Secundilactobacillus sp.]